MDANSTKLTAVTGSQLNQSTLNQTTQPSSINSNRPLRTHSSNKIRPVNPEM